MVKYVLTFFISTLSCHLVFSQISDKAEAIEDYYTNYLESRIDSDLLQWTGDVTNCNQGTISSIARDKLLQRINYFRRMVGVEDQIVFSSNLDDKCQQAALMMDANGSLSHDPPSNWLCFSTEGAEAAAKSNLFGGVSALPIVNRFNPVDDYIDDQGVSNALVGHRRWLLNSKAKIFGVGQTNNYNAMWVLQSTINPSVYNNFIAYPPAGYIPNTLVYDRWSFSVPGANFNNASVTVIDMNTNSIPISVNGSNNNGAGDNIIVWEPSGIMTDSSEDVLYTVMINGVVLTDGTNRNFTYTTKIFEPLILGDVNVDGHLNVGDALIIAQYTVGLRNSGNCENLIARTELCLSNADVDNDGHVDIGDALFVAQCTVGLTNALCPN